MSGLFARHVERSHAAVWSAIDQIARDNGFSPSGLAVEIGMDPTSFNKSRRVMVSGLRWPTMGTIARILAVTGMSFVEFGTLVDAGPRPTDSPASQDAAA